MDPVNTPGGHVFLRQGMAVPVGGGVWGIVIKSIHGRQSGTWWIWIPSCGCLDHTSKAWWQILIVSPFAFPQCRLEGLGSFDFLKVKELRKPWCCCSHGEPLELGKIIEVDVMYLKTYDAPKVHKWDNLVK